MKKETLRAAVLKTLCYADVFDYPLKKQEIWLRLISNQQFPQGELEKILDEKKGAPICFRQGYYFLRGRGKNVTLRKKRENWGKEKLKKARKIAKILRTIPTINLLAITGNLAAGNCEKHDDIDLLIVTSSGTLWLTRLLVTLLLETLGQRRRPGQKEVRNKICLNMFLDENHLKIPLKEQNLYVAHEIVQLKPLWQRRNTYQKFLEKSLWIKDYLPNSVRRTPVKSQRNGHGLPLFFSWLSVFERLARYLQMRYMAKRRTTEVIQEGVIRFHPQDVRPQILQKYQQKITRFSKNPFLLTLNLIFAYIFI